MVKYIHSIEFSLQQVTPVEGEPFTRVVATFKMKNRLGEDVPEKVQMTYDNFLLFPLSIPQMLGQTIEQKDYQILCINGVDYPAKFRMVFPIRIMC